MTRNTEITIETGTDTTHEISLFYSHGGWSIVWWVADYPDVPREGLDALHDYFRDELGIPEDVTAKKSRGEEDDRRALDVWCDDPELNNDGQAMIRDIAEVAWDDETETVTVDVSDDIEVGC